MQRAGPAAPSLAESAAPGSSASARAKPTSVSPFGTICLLPGPVAIAPAVTAAFHEPLVYHRADEFIPLFERVRARLSEMTGGTKKVALFVGSGTLANDAVAATLAADPHRGNGLVLVSGEFGGRLLKQARRWALDPRVLQWEWGQTWDLAAVEKTFAEMGPGGWVWAVHHETSTGVLNDLPALVALAKRYGIRVCLDTVSSLATVPVDLSGVYLASGASGKAVGSYAGIAFVFADPNDLAHLDTDAIPSYLDVLSTLHTVGPRFTVPSPLARALDVALEPLSTPALREARFAQIRDLGGRLRECVRRAGLTPMAADETASPAIVTFAPPVTQTAAEFVATCRRWGYEIAGQSGYLADRGLVQIAVMGHVTAGQIRGLFERLSG